MSKRSAVKFRLVDFRWLFLVSAIIGGSVASFGIVICFGLHLDADSGPYMLAMIPPMVLCVALSSAITLHSVRSKMGALLDGLQQVADGDLTVRLDAARAEEYAPIYENFNLMVREVAQSKAQMQNFVDEFSHEFKTPITSIQGFAQYLAESGEGVETPERMKYLRLIADESLRLSDLAQKTLLLTKIGSCQILTDKTNFALGEQLRQCVILLLPHIEKKRLELDLSMPDISYYGNAEWMEQVWLNLLTNAIKFTPEGGLIRLHALETEELITVTVADSGAGMEPQVAAHIFEKYFQGGGCQAVRGNGIGLSIVHRVVTLCGGQITVASQPGQGTAFTVTLPVNHNVG